MSARDDYPWLTDWISYGLTARGLRDAAKEANAALDEIDRLRDLIAARDSS